MKRMILAALAATGLATTAQADFGGPAVPPRSQGQTPMTPEEYRIHQSRYGLLPILRRVAWWKPAEPTPPQGGYPMAPHGPTVGHVPGMGAPGMGYPGPYGPGMGHPGMGHPGMGYPGMGPQGTLVFPHHPFARSPRDFFMWEPGRR